MKSEEKYFFQHDPNARHDPKLRALKRAQDWKGYAWYFVLLEIMTTQEDYRLKLSHVNMAYLCEELNCTEAELTAFIAQLQEFELMAIDENDCILSSGFVRRMIMRTRAVC